MFCKLSGLVTEAHTERWQPNNLRPYIDHVLNCFGIGRVIDGSDWPVIRLAATHERWIDVLLAAMPYYSAEDYTTHAPVGSISPARIATLRRFSAGVMGHDQSGL